MLIISVFKPRAASDPTLLQGNIDEFKQYLFNGLDKGNGQVDVSFQTLSSILPFPQSISKQDAGSFFARVCIFIAKEEDMEQREHLLRIAENFIDGDIKGGDFVLRQSSPALEKDRARVRSSLSCVRSFDG